MVSRETEPLTPLQLAQRREQLLDGEIEIGQDLVQVDAVRAAPRACLEIRAEGENGLSGSTDLFASIVTVRPGKGTGRGSQG